MIDYYDTLRSVVDYAQRDTPVGRIAADWLARHDLSDLNNRPIQGPTDA